MNPIALLRALGGDLGAGAAELGGGAKQLLSNIRGIEPLMGVRYIPDAMGVAGSLARQNATRLGQIGGSAAGQMNKLGYGAPGERWQPPLPGDDPQQAASDQEREHYASLFGPDQANEMVPERLPMPKRQYSDQYDPYNAASTYDPAPSAAVDAPPKEEGGLLSALSDALSAPRRLAWGAAGKLLGEDIPDSGTGVLSKYLGMDQDSMLTKGLGIGLEMLGDPLTYAGGSIGKAIGRTVGGGMDTARGLLAHKAALTTEAEGLNALRGGAETAKMEMARKAVLESAAPAMSKELNPELMSQLAPTPNVQAWTVGKSYKHVDPELAAHYAEQGLGEQLPGGGMRFLGMEQKPPASFVSGGRLFPHPDEVMPQLHQDTWASQWHRMRDELGNAPLKVLPDKPVSLARTLGDEEAARLQGMTPNATIPTVERPDLWRQHKLMGDHVMDMPVTDAHAEIMQRLGGNQEAMGQLPQLAKKLSPLERALLSYKGGV